MRNKFKYLYMLIFLIFIGLTIAILKDQKIDFNINDKNMLSVEVSDTGKTKISVTYTLANKALEDNFLFFKSSNRAIQVYIGDEEVYSYDNNFILFSLSKYKWHVIKIKDKYIGKEVKIYDNSSEDNELYDLKTINFVNDTNAILGNVMINDMPSILISLVIIFFSFLLIILWIITIRIEKSNNLLYLSILSILISIVFLINTNMARLIVQGNVLNIISFEISMLIPMVVILHYFEYKKSKLSIISITFPILSFIVANTLMTYRILNLKEGIMFANICLLIESFIYTEEHLYKVFVKKEKVTKAVDWAFIFMSITILIDVVNNDLLKANFYFIFSRIGIVFYIGTLAYDVFTELTNSLLIGKKARVYKNLAYNDILTGINNRRAFERDMKKIDGNHNKCNGTVIVMIDINNLKIVNDSKGHEAGDAYIAKIIKYIEANIEDLGKFYRTGGDEFVIVSSKKEYEKLKLIFEKMEEKIKISKSDMSFAFGFAEFNEEEDRSIYDTLKRADKHMYENKVNSKKNRK